MPHRRLRAAALPAGEGGRAGRPADHGRAPAAAAAASLQDIFYCIGNYKEGVEAPVQPLDMFLKSSDAVIGPDDTVELPPVPATIFHHEAELAVVLGRQTKWVAVERAMAHVFGYTCFIDVSARGIRRRAPGGRGSGQGLAGGRLGSSDVIACDTNHQGIGPIQDGESVEIEIERIGRMHVRVRTCCSVEGLSASTRRWRGACARDAWRPGRSRRSRVMSGLPTDGIAARRTVPGVALDRTRIWPRRVV
ncbi:MAG: hypothetical protein C4290_05935 [Chloroflexota bacterium]